MLDDYLLDVAQQINEETQEAKKLSHEKFKRDWLEVLSERPDKFKNEIQKAEYGKDIVICPEPITFIKTFDDVANQQDKCRELFHELCKGFEIVKIDQAPDNGIWFNTTLKGINLRPGLLNNERSNPTAITMGDQTVHGVIVGRTGAGKSVFLNNLIFNMITEYAPWELDLYLADFKKVELSRYMTRYQTPHLKACAATSEIRYVLSLIQNLVDNMYARQTFFARLGIQKLEDFRKKYPDIVLPRVLLLVDEFQQLFLEATSRETTIIQDLLMSIVKLGRATGFHLLFASQEMSGALSAKALANFKIRFSLPCEAEVSSAILGNSEAATLEIGNVLVNTASGKREDNMMFKVPFVSDDEDMKNGKESYFYTYLKELQEVKKLYTFDKVKKFYQEDFRTEMESLSEVLTKIDSVRSKTVSSSAGRYYDIITLGNAVVYTNKNIDLETFFIERGKNKNVFIVSPDVDDIAYIQKLLAINFKYSPNLIVNGQECQHVYFSFNPIVSGKYDICQDLPQVDIHENQDDISAVKVLYDQRKLIDDLLKSTNRDNLLEYIEQYFTILDRSKAKGPVEFAKAVFEGQQVESIADICAELLKQDEAYEVLTKPMMYFYDYHVNKKVTSELFSNYVIWISGMDSLDRLPAGFEKIAKNAMDMNILFVICISSEDSNLRTILSTCDYVFVSGNNPKLYERCGVNYTNKGRDSIVVDFKIRSMNTERSFKKYKCKLGESIAPSLDFDAIMG